MGWLWQQRDRSVGDKEFFSKEFNYSANGVEHRVIDTSRKGSVVYVACQVRRDQEDSCKVYAVVCKTSWDRKEKLNFGYKEIDESMGPIDSDCPQKILDLLTPTESEYALKWRKRCLDNIKRKKSLPKIKEGIIIDFDEPISWNGSIGEWRTFIAEKYGKRSFVYRGYHGGVPATQLLKITNMKTRKYVEVPENRIVVGRAKHFDDHKLFEIMSKGPYGNKDLVKGFAKREYLLKSIKDNFTDYANGIQELLIRTAQETKGAVVTQEIGQLWRFESSGFAGDISLFPSQVIEAMCLPVTSLEIDVIKGDKNSVVFACNYLYLTDALTEDIADIIENTEDDWEAICDNVYALIKKSF